MLPFFFFKEQYFIIAHPNYKIVARNVTIDIRVKG